MPFGLSFAVPLVLAGLIVLPALYFVLRATPPAPQRQSFPALRLLRGLIPSEQSPARMPLWLLLLRLLAAALLIIGFAGPEIVPPKTLPGSNPVLLAIDNDWAAAPDWQARLAAAREIIASAAAERGIILLPTAANEAGEKPHASGVLSHQAALARLDVLKPEPWPAARLADAAAVDMVRRMIGAADAVYLADGLIDGAGYHRFMTALHPIRVVGPDADAVRLVIPPRLDADGRLLARLRVVAQNRPVRAAILAEAADGRVLARSTIVIPPGRTIGEAPVDLPPALANQLNQLVLAGAAAPGTEALLDGSTRRIMAGLAAGGQGDAEQKFLGALYYVRRALPAGDKSQTGTIGSFIHGNTGVIVLADDPLDAPSIAALRHWIAQGGVLIRFAGPLTAARADPLSPDPLLTGDRRLGGALSWTKPEAIAAFAADSPLAGLAVPGSVRIRRQVLADPAGLAPDTVWARLTDGTPLVLGQRQGRGMLVYVLTTANAAWSNWPLSAGFPDFMKRLARLATHQTELAGISLKPLKMLDDSGDLVSPDPAARPLKPAEIAKIMVSPIHPPGLYGPSSAPVALNIGGHAPALTAASFPAGVPVTGLNVIVSPRYFGGDFLMAALTLLMLDLLISLRLRGLMRLGAAIAVIITLAPRAPASPPVPPAAVANRLAYIRTGDDAADQTVRQGLTALSIMVNQRTAARLNAPRGVVPGADPLDLYPMLYWRITGTTPAPDTTACRALTGFMASGGLLVIDTDGGDAGGPGSGAGFDPGATAALKQDVACLPIPPLRQLTERNTLAHTFYLLRDFPGRFTDAPAYIAAPGGQDADGVSPVVIGANGWASAWADEQALLPGGGTQRRDAGWFGVNLVMYALTGTYKSDQVQVPIILRRLSR